MKKKESFTPLPLFDSREFFDKQDFSKDLFSLDDLKHAKAFLKSYDGSEATFNAYRREVERLLHWSWLMAKKSVKDLRRADIEAYLDFCQRPPLSWIGAKKVPRFIEKEGQRLPNPAWRPFLATISKAANRKGEKANPKQYELSQVSFQEIFAILSSFYNFLIQEDYTEINPISHIRQKANIFVNDKGNLKYAA